MANSHKLYEKKIVFGITDSFSVVKCVELVCELIREGMVRACWNSNSPLGMVVN